jgi:hypothetical protein
VSQSSCRSRACSARTVASGAVLTQELRRVPKACACGCPPRDGVREGDGGLAVLPGSHKSKFKRPPGLFGPFGRAARERGEPDRSDGTGRWQGRATISAEQTLAGMKWVGPLTAGDAVIMAVGAATNGRFARLARPVDSLVRCAGGDHARRATVAAARSATAGVGLYPIVTLEKQLLNMIGKLV